MRSITNALSELSSYDSDLQSAIMNTATRIAYLENRIMDLERIIESITDIDWQTVKFIDRNEIST